jgi:cytoskeletal protein CcmA (bactofilin family)
MWKSSPSIASASIPELARPASAAKPLLRHAPSSMDQANIGRGLVIKGEIAGAEPLFIDGCVEGSINLPGNLVTVGPNGQVTANIAARDIVVLGKVCGNLIATNRLDIRAEAVVTGDGIAVRLTIEDGASINGCFDIRQSQVEPAVALEPAASATNAPWTRLAAQPGAGRLLPRPVPQSA